MKGIILILSLLFAILANTQDFSLSKSKTDLIELNKGLIISDGEISNLQIFSLTGELILGTDTPEKSINIDSLDSGTYTLRLIRNGHVEKQKFIKQ